MKKMIFAAIAALATVSMSSANYITIGDDVRVHPRYLDGYYKVTATMTVDGMLDDWQIVASYPDGVMAKLVSGIVPLDGMTIGYVDRFGAEQTYEAPLQVSANYGTISSHIAVQGYWDYDNDGYYDPYGSAKWLPGCYDMFEMNLYIAPEYRDGYIVFYETLTSGSDQRGAVLQGVRAYKRSHLWVGYMKGDINGDDRVNITDAMNLISYIAATDCDWNEFAVKAADFNDDGEINISDATALITYIRTEN